MVNFPQTSHQSDSTARAEATVDLHTVFNTKSPTVSKVLGQLGLNKLGDVQARANRLGVLLFNLCPRRMEARKHPAYNTINVPMHYR